MHFYAALMHLTIHILCVWYIKHIHMPILLCYLQNNKWHIFRQTITKNDSNLKKYIGHIVMLYSRQAAKSLLLYRYINILWYEYLLFIKSFIYLYDMVKKKSKQNWWYNVLNNNNLCYTLKFCHEYIYHAQYNYYYLLVIISNN